LGLIGNRLIGVLGGTFNPIHFGHLRMAQELADALNLQEVRFIPSANPPHKTAPEVSANHRAAMVQLAINDNPIFKLDTRELERTGASYTIDTLMSLREELDQVDNQHAALCLTMGSDAFVYLNTWHRWQELLNYCHIILVQRPNTSRQPKLPDELAILLQSHYTENLDDLANKSAGCIHMQAITPLEISSTKIREAFNCHASTRYLMPEPVISYIITHKLY
jgi:nicotinate-nucleotide adenylyltransferase